MNYGLYLSAAGVMSALHRQDIYANNLANVETVGFKADAIDIRQRLPERVGRPVPGVAPHALLERLGGAPTAHWTRVDLTQGSLEMTGGPLDVAIRGDGFLVVDMGQVPGGGPDGDFRLTRDGRLAVDEADRLVLAASGRPVMDERGRVIRVDSSSPVEIRADGQVSQNGAVTARLALVPAIRPEGLVKDGDGLLRSEGAAIDVGARADGRVVQGAVESSSVDPIRMLTGMMQASRALELSARLMQYHDHAMGEVINTFGRIA